MAYVTLDSIVRDLLNDEDKNSTHEYLRLLKIANRGLKELTFDVLGNVRVAVLDVDDALRVDLPTDYVDYSFVGVVSQDYVLEPLGRNTKIPANGDGNILFSPPEEYNYTYGGMFGLGGGQNWNGYYRPEIDVENWQMILGGVSPGVTLYLEYISNGQLADNRNVIHEYAEEALIAWTYWKSIQKKRTIPANEKEAARRDYYNQKRITNSRMGAFTKEEALQQFRKGFKMAPKI